MCILIKKYNRTHKKNLFKAKNIHKYRDYTPAAQHFKMLKR